MSYLYIEHRKSTIDHKYANFDSIFGIYIHELAYILIFKAFVRVGRGTYWYVEMTITLLGIPYFNDR